MKTVFGISLTHAAKRVQSEPIAVISALPSRLPCSGIAIAIVAGNGKIFFLFPSALARAASHAGHLPLSARAAPGPRRSRPGRVCHARAARQARQPASAAPVGSGCVLPRLRSAAARLPSAAGKPRPTPTGRPIAKQPEARAAAASAAPASRSRPAGAGR